MDSFINLLVTSKNQYRELLKKTEEIGANVNTIDTDGIRKYHSELSFLLDEAQNVDKKINEMAITHLNDLSNDLFQDRFQLMRKFLEINKSVASQINAKRSVLQSEYIKIRKGRAGIVGYQSSIKPSTRLINKSY